VCTTPFGLPVEPLVFITVATSFAGSISTCSGKAVK